MTKVRIKTLIYCVLATLLVASCSATPSDLEGAKLQGVNDMTGAISVVNAQSADAIPQANKNEFQFEQGGGVSIRREGSGAGSDPVVYTGEPVEISYTLGGRSESGEAELGVILFLDGAVQPYRVVETSNVDIVPMSEDEATMSVFQYTEDTDEVTFTLSFMPVTGEKGETLCLSPLIIFDPLAVPDEDRGFDYFALDGKFYPSSVSMEQDAEATISNYTVEAEALYDREPDPSVTPDPSLDSPKFFLYSGIETKFPKKLVTKDHQIDLTVRVAGGLERDYRVTLFVNNEPINVEGHPDFLMHSQYDNTVEYTFPLDLESYGRVNMLYAVFVPLEDDCDSWLFSGEMSEPILLIRN